MSNSKNKIRKLFYSAQETNRRLAFELAKSVGCYEEILDEFYTALQELPSFEAERENWLLLMQELYEEEQLTWPSEELALKQLHIEGFCSVYFQEKMSLAGTADDEPRDRLSAFPKVVLNCTFVTQLDLSWNDLETLPPEIEQLTNLEKLDLSCNYRLRNLPANLANLPYLEDLILYGIEGILEATQYDEKDPRREEYNYQLPDFFRGMNQLRKLDLGEVHIRELPDWIGELSNLESLLLFTKPENNPTVDLTNHFIQFIKLLVSYWSNYIVVVPERMERKRVFNYLAIEPTAHFYNNTPTTTISYLNYYSVGIQLQEVEAYGGLFNWNPKKLLKSLSSFQYYSWAWLKEITLIKELTDIQLYGLTESERKELEETLYNCNFVWEEQ